MLPCSRHHVYLTMIAALSQFNRYPCQREAPPELQYPLLRDAASQRHNVQGHSMLVHICCAPITQLNLHSEAPTCRQDGQGNKHEDADCAASGVVQRAAASAWQEAQDPSSYCQFWQLAKTISVWYSLFWAALTCSMESFRCTAAYAGCVWFVCILQPSPSAKPKLANHSYSRAAQLHLQMPGSSC